MERKLERFETKKEERKKLNEKDRGWKEGRKEGNANGERKTNLKKRDTRKREREENQRSRKEREEEQKLRRRKVCFKGFASIEPSSGELCDVQAHLVSGVNQRLSKSISVQTTRQQRTFLELCIREHGERNHLFFNLKYIELDKLQFAHLNFPMQEIFSFISWTVPLNCFLNTEFVFFLLLLLLLLLL